MQVYSSVQEIVQELKKDLGLSNASEVIAYLYAFYDSRRETILLEEHKAAMQRIKEIINQTSM